jgi:uncharacterized membrane protein
LRHGFGHSRCKDRNYDIKDEKRPPRGWPHPAWRICSGAGLAHLSFARKAFKAQVPDWVPLKEDDTVVYSGYVEIALGLALMIAPRKQRSAIGKIAAGFFTAVFPGNIAQYAHHRDSLGLDTDTKRFTRLFFQPVLVYAALETTKDAVVAA